MEATCLSCLASEVTHRHFCKTLLITKAGHIGVGRSYNARRQESLGPLGDWLPHLCMKSVMFSIMSNPSSTTWKLCRKQASPSLLPHQSDKSTFLRGGYVT